MYNLRYQLRHFLTRPRYNLIDCSSLYSSQELKAGVEGIDASRKEAYLADADFSDAFGMTKEEFGKMAKWKQQGAKKKVGLF